MYLELVTDEEHRTAQQFYDDVGQLAVDSGYVVTIPCASPCTSFIHQSVS
jgi:hypothetical protein